MAEPTPEQYSESERRVEHPFHEVFGGILQRWVMPVICTETDTMQDSQDCIVPERQLVIASLRLAH